jgi:hypothetical protein
MGQHAATKTPEPKPKRERSAKRDRELDAAASFYEHIVPPADPEELQFRHGHWAGRRRAVRAALASTGTRTHALNRFDECGGGCVVMFSPTLQRYRLQASYCKSRHCEPCMRAKANRVAARLREKLADQSRDRTHRRDVTHRFITLTRKHSSKPLADQIRGLFQAFKKLRSTKLWKASQVGGAFVLEVKWTGAAWHPHLHVIAQGTFIDRQRLSEAWHEATGDSWVVDVRALAHDADACHYLTKYLTKGTNALVWQDPTRAQEWVIATKGVRTCNTYGTWRGFALATATPEASDWTPVFKLTDLIRRAVNGELAAQTILLTLRPPGSTDHVPAERPPPNA